MIRVGNTRRNMMASSNHRVDGAWAAAATALRSFISANYNQANPHNQAVMASPPTITVTSGTTPPTGLTQAFRYSTSSPGLTYRGGWTVTFATTYRRFPVATIAATGGSVGSGMSAVSWRVSAVCNAQKVAFRVYGGTNFAYRFIVDGKYASTAATIVSTSGSNFVTLDFGTKAARTITVEGAAAAAFDGIYVGTSDSVTAATSNSKRMIVLGDSFTSGIGATVTGDGFAYVTGDMLGISDIHASGVGGTGYVNTVSGTRYKLSERLSDVNSRGPWDIIVVAMGINDVSLSTASITAEAYACLTSIRAANPSSQIYVVGPWDDNAPAAVSADYTACKNAIRAGIPPGIGATFFDPEGVVFTQADGLHPDNAGHDTLGDWLALKIKNALGA